MDFTKRTHGAQYWTEESRGLVCCAGVKAANEGLRLKTRQLVSKFGQLLRVGGDLPLRRIQLADQSLLPQVVSFRADLALLLKSADNLSVVPAELGRQPANSAVLPPGLQPQHPQSLRNNHPLLGVVWRRDALKDFETVHGSFTTGGLVGNHPAHSLIEDTRRGTEVERSMGLVEAGGLAEVGMVLQFVAEELAGDVEGLASHNNNLLTVEKLLGYRGGQATKEMSLAIDNDHRLECGHSCRRSDG